MDAPQPRLGTCRRPGALGPVPATKAAWATEPWARWPRVRVRWGSAVVVVVVAVALAVAAYLAGPVVVDWAAPGGSRHGDGQPGGLNCCARN